MFNLIRNPYSQNNLRTYACAKVCTHAHCTCLPLAVLMSSFMVLSLTTVCLMRLKSALDQVMAPATGGWFFEMGGLSLWSLNSWLMESTCRMDREGLQPVACMAVWCTSE